MADTPTEIYVVTWQDDNGPRALAFGKLIDADKTRNELNEQNFDPFYAQLDTLRVH